MSQAPHPFSDVSRFVITGVSGWVGRALVSRLANGLGANWRNHIALFGSREGPIDLGADGVAQVRALASMRGADTQGAYVFHLAFLGKERLDDLSITEFINRNCAIDDAVLSAFRNGRPRRVFVSSSGAAADTLYAEKRNGYGLCKLLQEDRFLDWSNKSGDLFVGRIYNLSGPFVNKLDSYALSSCIIQSIQNGSIILNSKNLTYRSYIHINDVIDLILGTVSAKREIPSIPLDICGSEIVEVGEIATFVGAQFGIPNEKISRPPINFDNPNIYLGNYTVTHSLKHQFSINLRSFEHQVQDTAKYIMEVLAAS